MLRQLTKADRPKGDFFLECSELSRRDHIRTLEDVDFALEELASFQTFSDKDFVELSALLNNAGYLCLYLESNNAHLQVPILEDLKQRLFGNQTRMRRFHQLVSAADFTRPELRKSQDAFVKAFSQSNLDNFAGERLRLERHLASCLSAIASNKADLVLRLGSSSDMSPHVMIYQMLANEASASVREKIAFASAHVEERETDSIAEAIDRLVAHRWLGIQDHSHDSVSAASLEGGTLTPEAARGFLVAALPAAIQDTMELTTEMAGRIAGEGNLDADFPRYVSEVRGTCAIPRMPLEPCLLILGDIAKDIFGLDLVHVADSVPHLISFDVFEDNNTIGRINFDLWGTERVANTTYGFRNGLQADGLSQRPVAHLSCRFRKADSVATINFQNAHSLFHEFGHALNHVAMRQTLPNLSGLDHLPPERLEVLSMWFERWVFHRDFGNRLGFSAEQSDGLRRAQTIKCLEYRRTHLERLLLSLIDLDIHSERGLTVTEAYERIVRDMPDAALCPLRTLLPSFALPMTLTRPGGYVAYPWAAADSAERFRPFMDGSFPDGSGYTKSTSAFEDCFDCDLPSRTPDVGANIRFYRDADRS